MAWAASSWPFPIPIDFLYCLSTCSSTFICFCKQQLLLVEIYYVIYFSQSQLLLEKTNEHRTTSRKPYSCIDLVPISVQLSSTVLAKSSHELNVKSIQHITKKLVNRIYENYWSRIIFLSSCALHFFVLHVLFSGCRHIGDIFDIRTNFSVSFPGFSGITSHNKYSSVTTLFCYWKRTEHPFFSRCYFSDPGK